MGVYWDLLLIKIILFLIDSFPLNEKDLKELILCHKLYLSLQPNVVDLRYFKL